MTNYLNCDPPKEPFGRIICNECGKKYDFRFSKIRAPYKEHGILKCHCGVALVSWNSTTETFLTLVKE